MADTKLTALTETTSPATSDDVYIVTTPGGTPASKRCTIANLSTAMGVAGGILTGGRVLISEQTPTATGTVTWSSIAATYTSLEIEIIARTDKAATVTGMNLRFNNDTTDANYRRDSLTQGGATVSGGSADNADALLAVAANGLASNAAYGIVKIPYYAKTVFHKVAHIRTAYREGASTSNQNFQSVYWENTAAINRIDIIVDDASNYVTGTTFRLYGVY